MSCSLSDMVSSPVLPHQRRAGASARSIARPVGAGGDASRARGARARARWVLSPRRLGLLDPHTVTREAVHLRRLWCRSRQH